MKARAEDASDATAMVEENLISDEVKAAIADDNLTYESELLSLIRSDAATPSSTASAGDVVAEPANEGVGPRDEAQDVTMGVEPNTTLGSESAPGPGNEEPSHPA